ncbi:MAG: zinc ribbon domain-containing protein [Candidatus Omnitrophica bacterium]|nr:zinc ribbon domain-containing protein [Candidatus Omnitrophota bacterium]
MTFDDEEFDSIPEEKEPESLRRKWDAEDLDEMVSGKLQKPCPHCGEMIGENEFFCLYCGKRVLEEAGLISKLAALIQKGQWIWWIAAAVIIYLVFVNT